MNALAPWRAIVDGAMAEQAQAAARAIFEALPDHVPASGAEAEPRSWQYAQVALAYAYAAKALGDATYAKRAEGFLDQAQAALLDEGDAAISLYGGVAGVALCAADAARNLGTTIALDELDEVIENYVGAERWAGPYDLVSGLVGLGVYALGRLPSSKKTLAAVLRHLAALAARRAPADGATRHQGDVASAPGEAHAGRSGRDEGLLWPVPRGDGGGLRCDLGIAHGAPGVIALAAHCLAAGVEVEQSERLVRGALQGLHGQRLPASAASAYPYFTGAGIEPTATKPAWCYGDPGVAVALLAAARALPSASLEGEAITLARRAAARDPAESKIFDAGLCHGTLGTAHLLNRLYQATGDEGLGAGARAWFARGLATRREGRGVGGYAFYYAPDGKTTQWVDDPTFLSGAAGVALALLAFTSDAEPTWDRLLLLSSAP
ncbi:MAG: hypothetical protein MUF34_05050 [Polyangiaceae bacterium]|nr:hypothetical protein [Polyangiaceae bacterium]